MVSWWRNVKGWLLDGGMEKDDILVEECEMLAFWLRNVNGWCLGERMLKDGVLVDEC